jgi:hypothetical protein
MTNRTISVGSTPQIFIEAIGGDLSIVGWEGEDLLIKADDDDADLKQDGDRVIITSHGDLTLRVPRLATLCTKTVDGDIALRGVNGDIEIDKAQGDVSIRDIGNVKIGSVQADLNLRTSRGNVKIKNIFGDASIRDVQGDVSLDSVGDDLALREVQGNLWTNVGGDVVLYLDPQLGKNYSVNAGDDVMLILSPSADANLELKGDEIYLDWPGVPFSDESTSRIVTLGSGASRISISAGGELRVSNREKTQHSPEEFGNFASMMLDWSDFGTQLGAKISRRVEDATRRISNQAERVARRAEAKLRGKAVHGRVNIGPWDWNIDSSTITPPVSSEPVSEGERLVILKMLAEKKISAEEADKLLAALEED